MYRSRKFTAVAGLAVAGIFLAACSSGGSSDGADSSDSAGDVTIDFLAPEYSSVTAGYWEDLISNFESDNPGIHIDLTMVSWDDIRTKLQTLISTGAEPDLLNFDEFSTLAGDNLLMPMEDALSQDVYDDLIPVMRENGELDDTGYGIPLLASARALFYNKDLMDEAGADVPTTWEELKQSAQQVKDETGEIGYGMPFGELEGQAEFGIWAQGNGGGWQTDDGDWAINSDANVEAMQFAQGLFEDGVTQPSPWTTSRDDLFRLFGQGKIGLIEGASFLPAVMKSQDSTVEYDIAPSPTNGDVTPTSLAVVNYLMVFESTEHSDEVSKFLSYFYQDGDNYQKLLTNEGMLPVTHSGAEAMKDDPVAGPFVDLLELAQFYPINPEWSTVADEVRAKVGLAIKDDPQNALDDLQAFAESQS